MSTGKIFGIGFQKTGTKSLATALKFLGYRVTGPNFVMDPDIRHKVHELAFSLVGRYDAFQDNPWPILYRELDAGFPGSKFILTLRPTDNWIKSVVSHFGSKTTPMREWIYGAGSPLGNEQRYIDRFEKHNREVLDYFRHRPQDLRVMQIGEGEEWELLCGFLGKPIPAVKFPHANAAAAREAAANRVVG